MSCLVCGKSCDCDDIIDKDLINEALCEICTTAPCEPAEITCKDCFYDTDGNPCLHGL